MRFRCPEPIPARANAAALPAQLTRCRTPRRGPFNPDEARIAPVFPICTCSKDPHDRSSAIRHHRQDFPLADRGASAGAIPDRLADAGPSSQHEAGRPDDFPRLRWIDHTGADRSAVDLAACPSGGARKLAAALAARDLRSRALVALFAGAGNHHYRLAVRVVSRLVAVVLLSGAAADAGVRE